MKDSIDDLGKLLDSVDLRSMSGRVVEIVGMVIKAIAPKVRMGEICAIKRKGSPLLAEVVGFTKKEVFLSPLGDMMDIGVSSEVIPTGKHLEISVGDDLLGRILDGVGNPLDDKGPLDLPDKYPVKQHPPDPLSRTKITDPISVGVKCIDGVLTCGRGQRVGIFAAAGGGKSTLLGMIARNAKADINVIALVGERGREVKEFLENDLGEEGLNRSVVVVSTSDQQAQLRINAAYVGTAIAEYFRDKGKNVILMVDSITRFARALREVTLAAGEPPARSGFTPSVFAILPKLLERSGNSNKGSVTAFYNVLVEGDDITEPVSDEVKSILDGHIVLSTELASQNHYPAIDVLKSISRLLNQIVSKRQLEDIRKIREVLSNYKKSEILLQIGEYKPGADKKTDYAIKYFDKVNRFLQQDAHEKSSMKKTLEDLSMLFR